MDKCLLCCSACPEHDNAIRRDQASSMEARGYVREKTLLISRKTTSIAGHVSRKMLENYSPIRLQAKRTALDAISGKDTLQDPPTPSGQESQKEGQAVN